MTDSPLRNTEPLLTVTEAAARLQCSKANVYSLIRRGIVPIVRVGAAKGYRIDPRDIEAFIQQRKETKSSRPRNTMPPRPRLRHIRL